MSNGSFKNVKSKIFYENMILETIERDKTKKTNPYLNRNETSKFEYICNITSGRNSTIQEDKQQNKNIQKLAKNFKEKKIKSADIYDFFINSNQKKNTNQNLYHKQPRNLKLKIFHEEKEKDDNGIKNKTQISRKNSLEKFKLLLNIQEDTADKSFRSRFAPSTVKLEENYDQLPNDDYRFSKIKKQIKSIIIGNEEIVHKILNEKLILDEKQYKHNKMFLLSEEIKRLPHIKNRIGHTNRNLSPFLKKRINDQAHEKNPNSIDPKTNFILSCIKRNNLIEREKQKISPKEKAARERNLEEKIKTYHNSIKDITAEILDNDNFIIYTGYFVDNIERYKNVTIADEEIKNCIMNFKLRESSNQGTMMFK